MKFSPNVIVHFFQTYADFVISVMGKICAPVRDDQIKKLAEMTDVVAIFRGIMEVCVTPLFWTL